MNTNAKTKPSYEGKFSRPVYLMVFFSGFAGLVYQILWMKQLGFLFGNTSHAAATTLAAFFAGLACGSFYWGRRSKHLTNPLMTYALLEIGIAVTAVLYFGIMAIFYAVYPFVYQHVASAGILLAVKFILALLLVFPPSFCMGGTIPVIGQFLVRRADQLGIRAALIYGINTLGAAVGAFLTGFYLVRVIGFRWTCIGAMVVSALVAAAAYSLSRSISGSSGKEFGSVDNVTGNTLPSSKAIKGWVNAICFVSGFSVLALEVLWTRLFAQIHENTIYSFSLVLVIVLICLAVGALLSSILSRLPYPPLVLLSALMVLGGLAIALSPFVLMDMTDGLSMMDTRPSFWQYMLKLFATGFGFVGPPALMLGMVFPFMMKVEERFVSFPGSSLGRMAAINTIGAVIGSVLCGFVFLEHLGVWRTMQVFACLYLFAGIMLPVKHIFAGIMIKSAGVIIFLMLFKGLDPAELPVTGYDPARPPERVLEVWESSDCTVSVIQTYDGHHTIKINSNYSLGSTGAFSSQDFQGRMPLLVYPETESIFFLGMGTGVTAGAALDRQFTNVRSVVTCELVPEVVEAAETYFAGGGVPGIPDLTRGLFQDERSEIIVEDGRHYLMASGRKFDMINADLFLPYRSGAASLYTREHFEAVKASLNPGGVFVQWLPMYQITGNEFGVIAKTMLSVFDQVTMWRNNFQPGGEVVALIGQTGSDPVPSTSLDSSDERKQAVAGKGYKDLPEIMLPLNEETILLVYCGNLSKADELFEECAVNTDNKPVIEYTAPLSIRNISDDPNFPPTLIGPRLAKLIDRIQEICPPKDDPMLRKRTHANRRLPYAGKALHRVWINQAMMDDAQSQSSWGIFVREWTAD